MILLSLTPYAYAENGCFSIKDKLDTPETSSAKPSINIPCPPNIIAFSDAPDDLGYKIVVLDSWLKIF